MFFRGNAEDLNITPEKHLKEKVYALTQGVVCVSNPTYKYTHVEFGKINGETLEDSDKIMLLTGPYANWIELKFYEIEEDGSYRFMQYHTSPKASLANSKVVKDAFVSQEELQQLADKMNEKSMEKAKKKADRFYKRHKSEMQRDIY